MRVGTMIPANLWLWTTMLTPMSRAVVVRDPIHPCRHERIDGKFMSLHDLDFPEGTVLMTTDAGLIQRHGTSFVVLDGRLQHVWEHEAQDLLDPAEATTRLHGRLRRDAGLDDVSRRFRFPDGHSLTKGQFRVRGGWYAVVTEVTARQAWMRAATTDEILAAGGVLPVAPVGAELLDAIRAEAAQEAAEAAAAA
jgi:hypothetical protein